MIVLDILLKLWIEPIISRNDNAMDKFYSLRMFENVKFLMKISKLLKIFKKMKDFFLLRSCSTSYPSGNQVDGSPLVAIMIYWFVTFKAL